MLRFQVYQFQFIGGGKFFESVIKRFFMIHDPTTENEQGSDQGSEYGSVVYCSTDEQWIIARQVRQELSQLIASGVVKYNKWRHCNNVTTEVCMMSDFSPFFRADESHQQYLRKHPGGHCNHKVYLKSWPVIPRHKHSRQAKFRRRGAIDIRPAINPVTINTAAGPKDMTTNAMGGMIKREDSFAARCRRARECSLIAAEVI